MSWDRNREQHELAVERTAEARRRTHLANERTYAAWVRTALALIALGVGMAGYFHIVEPRRGQMFVAVGICFVVAGAVMAALAAYAYRKTYTSIEKGQYGSSIVLTLVLGAIPIVTGLLALLLIMLR